MTPNDEYARREKTDESLRTERRKADDRVSAKHRTVDDTADDVVRIARERADEVVQTARDAAPDARGTADVQALAHATLAAERETADAELEHERANRRLVRVAVLDVERALTDRNLTDERGDADARAADLREANAQMVATTLRAHDLADEADAARQRAEMNERELREIAEFRELFIGILGHDLRTPLMSISMSTERLIGRGKLDAPDAAIVARINRSVQRMTRMIMQLLDLTRARLGGGMPIERGPADIGDICEHVVDEFDTGVQLEVEGDVTGYWDADRMTEVFANLVGNAVHYATPDTPVIVKASAANGDVVVEVVNQGPEIPAHVLPHIFEPFRQAGYQVKSAAGNLGLGLYIAHEIVRAHGGTIEARSTGGLTSFVVRLPRKPASSQAMAVAAPRRLDEARGHRPPSWFPSSCVSLRPKAERDGEQQEDHGHKVDIE
jgi:signal transduction histidine kinase